MTQRPQPSSARWRSRRVLARAGLALAGVVLASAAVVGLASAQTPTATTTTSSSQTPTATSTRTTPTVTTTAGATSTTATPTATATTLPNRAAAAAIGGGLLAPERQTPATVPQVQPAPVQEVQRPTTTQAVSPPRSGDGGLLDRGETSIAAWFDGAGLAVVSAITGATLLRLRRRARG